MNGDSLARQFTGTSQAKDVAKSAAQKRSEEHGDKRSQKCGEKRGEKFDRRKFTAAWDLSRLFSFRLRDLVGNPLSWPLSLEIWQCPGFSLSAAQPVVERKAAECAEGFHPQHSWCHSD